jgi:cytoskeletal protein RodZ
VLGVGGTVKAANVGAAVASMEAASSLAAASPPDAASPDAPSEPSSKPRVPEVEVDAEVDVAVASALSAEYDSMLSTEP